jgi:predicted ATPase/class 3 adenylate cyclase/transcriptional regulator with XRE-family HTH domain
VAEPGLSFAGLLRQLRAEARLTQEELAEAARLSPRSISDLERGINRTARKDTAWLLADALRLDGPVRELFVAAARGKVPAAEVLSARIAQAPGHFSAIATWASPPDAASGGVAGLHMLLFTDIEGSTALLQRVGADVYARVLADHHGLIRSALASHGGVEVNTAGDGFFAEFASPRACVAAVLEMQQALGSHDWPGGERVRVRMGVHAGEADLTAAGLVGLDVHRASRIAAVAHGGQVLVSETAAALAGDGLPSGVALKDLGVHRLKGLGRPERLFQLCGPGLAAKFPPLRSLGNSALPTNLPAQLTVFIGREQELSEVRALAASSRLVTLIGPGGCGKTRLGLQVAGMLLDGSGDGVWLVELAAVTDQDAVPAAVAGALRIPSQPGRPVLDVVGDALGPQDLLIVLDNCEHLIGGCAKTAETILQQCPKVHLIATSREPLGIGGERIYRVPSLSLPEAGDDDAAAARSCDAVALLTDRARAQGVTLALDAEATPVAVSVCRQLDGMPLAIELAAARLRSMSLAELAGRLDRRFGLLTGGSRTALPRQQTLRAAIGWSHALLTPAAQLLLGRLSVFAGGFDLPAAEAVCGYGTIDAAEVAVLVGSLVDKSLVVAESEGPEVRYRLLETIRLFAAERLAGTGGPDVAAARTAHCTYYLAVAETAAPHLFGSEQGIWFGRLEAEDANLLRAAEHAAGQPDATAQVLRLAIALWPYWGHWVYRGQEAAALLVPVLARPDAAADPAVFAEALFAASTLVGDVAACVRLAEQMDQVASELGDNRLLAMSRGQLAEGYWSCGELERAWPLGQEAVQRARQLGDDVQLARSLSACILSAHPIVPAVQSGSGAQTAAPLYAEAIACTERSGDLLLNSLLHNNAGCYRLYIGDIPAARAHLEASIRAAEMIGRPQPSTLDTLGDVLRAEGDLDGARSAFEDALQLSRRIGQKKPTAAAIVGLASLAADTGEWHRAAVLHGAAQALADQTGFAWDPDEEGYRQESLDQIAAALGDEQLKQAYTQGTALSLDHAIDLALSKSTRDATITVRTR